MFKQIIHKQLNNYKPRWIMMILIAGMVGIIALGLPTSGQAHCDSENGPVVTAARQALDKGNVKLILPYVKPDDEANLTEAFKHAREVRQLGPKAKVLADQYFLETAVRLHRTGEGASFTGITDEPVPAAIQAADKAMQTGSLDEVNTLLSKAIQQGVQEKYKGVVAAREAAAKAGTVEAQRERVEAELGFEKYVYGLYTTAAGAQTHAEGAAH